MKSMISSGEKGCENRR